MHPLNLKTTRKRLGLNAFSLFFAILLFSLFTSVAFAADIIFVPDSGGENDIDASSGSSQKDLSAYGVNGTGEAGTPTQYGWKWDEQFLSGGNTQMVCVYLSVANDGSPSIPEYFVCYEINANAEGVISTDVVTTNTCSNFSTDKCTGSNPALASNVLNATGQVSVTASSQFLTDDNPDAQAIVTLNPIYNLSLVNICSKPGTVQSSVSSDCGLAEAPGFLKLKKVVQNGPATPDDWSLLWDGPGASDGDVSGGNDQFIPLVPGPYALSEAGPNTYEQTALVCSGGTLSDSTVTITGGAEVTCTFYNRLKPGSIKLVKVVDNLGGGGSGPNDFGLTVGVTPTTSGATVTVISGTHTIAETATPGYIVGRWNCSDGTLGAQGSTSANVGVSPDEAVTCTITNTKIAAVISIVKTGTWNDGAPANGVANVGESITYAFAVKNEGNVTLNNVMVMDTIGGVTVSGGPTTLDVGETDSTTFTGSYIITQADIDNGSFYNKATAVSNESVPATDDVTVQLPPDPDLTLQKTASPLTYAVSGTLINYTYRVTNTGNLTLGPVTVDDDKADVSCPPGDLAPLQALTCTATYTITQTDLDAGSVTNVATATADGTDSNQAQATVTAVPDPDLIITKIADPQTYDSVGDVISYTIVATNTGNVTLYGVQVTDLKVSNLTCEPIGPTTLAPDGEIKCTARHTITQEDLNAGEYQNTACVDDSQAEVVTRVVALDDAAEVCATETVGGQQNSALEITKVAEQSSYNAVGDVITYSIIATNTGNAILFNVTVTDPKVSNLTCTNNGANLLPNEKIVCTATHTVVQSDIDAGSYANAACVDDAQIQTFAVVAPVADEVCADEVVPAVQEPALTIDKTGTVGPVTIGDTVLYTISVRNTGNVTLTNVTVTDVKLKLAQVIPVLAVNETKQFTGSYGPITENDVAGPIFNTATATAKSPKDETVGPVTDTHETPVTISPALILHKSASPTTFTAVGEVIVYTYRMTNTGNVNLSGPFTVADDKTIVTCPAEPAKLAVGEGITCTATYVITAADYAAGFVTNVAKGNAKDPNGKDIPSTVDEETATRQDLPGTIGDRVWLDQDQDGIQDSGEPGVPGVTVNLYKVEGGDTSTASADATPFATTKTGDNGIYLFTNQLEGEYYVEFIAPTGYNYTKFAVAGSQPDNDSNAEMPTILLSVSDGGKEGEFDQNMLYIISYTNSDTGRPANNVVLTTTVPVGTIFVANQSTTGWSCTGDAEGSVCTFNVGTLAPSGAGSLNFVVKLKPEDQSAAVPDVLDLIVHLVQGNLARTPNLSLPNGGINRTIDAGLISSVVSDQTPTPTDPTSLPGKDQPKQQLDLFLPTLRLSDASTDPTANEPAAEEAPQAQAPAQGNSVYLPTIEAEQ